MLKKDKQISFHLRKCPTPSFFFELNFVLNVVCQTSRASNNRTNIALRWLCKKKNGSLVGKKNPNTQSEKRTFAQIGQLLCRQRPACCVVFAKRCRASSPPSLAVACDLATDSCEKDNGSRVWLATAERFAGGFNNVAERVSFLLEKWRQWFSTL